MIKALISPLAWFLVLVILRALIGLRQGRRRSTDAWLLLLTIGVWLLSSTYVSSGLEQTIAVASAPDSVSNTPTRVIVLAGGSSMARDRRVYLSQPTIERVVRGAEVFQKSQAQSIVMTGRSLSPDRAAEVVAMKELAVRLGVPAEKIALEPQAVNTFEHPSRVVAEGLASPSERVIIVTEPMHLRRAMTEFHRLFPFAEAAATRPAGRVGARDPISWIPQADALDKSTKVIREWIGMAWYAIEHRSGR